MRGLFGRRRPGRGHRSFPNWAVLGFVLLVTQALVPHLLADNHYTWSAIAELSCVQVNSGHTVGMAVRLEDGKTLATCAHVVGSNRWVTINGNDNALVLATDVENDIAILRAGGPGRPFDTQWGIDTAPMGTGVVIAARLDDGPIRIHRTTVLGPGYKNNPVAAYMAQKGYSGGPVFTTDGKLLGIVRGESNTSTYKGTDFIPVWKIRTLIDNTRKSLNNR